MFFLSPFVFACFTRKNLIACRRCHRGAQRDGGAGHGYGEGRDGHRGGKDAVAEERGQGISNDIILVPAGKEKQQNLRFVR